MIDMHVGFTGGELRGSPKQEPSIFRAALRHLEAVRCLLYGKVGDAMHNEREALSELARVAERAGEMARSQANAFLSSNDGGFSTRVARDILRRANDLLGEPIRSGAEIRKHPDEPAPMKQSDSAQAPVFLYVTWDSEKGPIEDFLKARKISYRVLPVDRDDTMLSLIRRETGSEPPAIGIGDKIVADLASLRRLDEAGELSHLLSGQPS